MLSLRILFQFTYSMIYISYTLAYVELSRDRSSITENLPYKFLDHQFKSQDRANAYNLGILLGACRIRFYVYFREMYSFLSLHGR